MAKLFKFVFILSVSLLLTSCLGDKEPSMYAEQFAVIKEGSASIKYFSGDDGTKMVPQNNAWNTAWGNTGDRVYVRFNYNPYAISENWEMYVTVQSVTKIQTEERALDPANVDTDTLQGTLLSYDKYDTQTRAAQGFLTVLFYAKYANIAKHSFGFLEDTNRIGRDTLFLRMWHSVKETDTPTNIAENVMSLKIDNYANQFYADTIVIALKYKSEGYNGTVEDKTVYAKYGKKSW